MFEKDALQGFGTLAYFCPNCKCIMCAIVPIDDF